MISINTEFAITLASGVSVTTVTSEGDDLYAVVIEVVGTYSPVKAVIAGIQLVMKLP